MGAKRKPGFLGLGVGLGISSKSFSSISPAAGIFIPSAESSKSLAGSGVLATIIAQCCDPKPIGGYRAYLSRGQKWVIGTYSELRRLTLAWRTDDQLRTSLFNLGARIGRRETDVAPQGDREVKSFKAKVKGKNPEVPSETLYQKFASQRTGHQPDRFKPRVTDQYEAAKDYFLDQTLEAHHIVEKSILGVLGMNTGELENKIAPCVLVVAELHRRLFTAEVAGSRRLFAGLSTTVQATRELDRIYGDLYKDPVMEDLRKISTIISHKACSKLV